MQENKTLGEIEWNLICPVGHLFYWKKQYDWDKRKFEYEHEKDAFSQELLELARKMMRKLNNDLDKNSHTNQSEIYSFMNILKKHSVAQRIRSNYFPNQTKTTKLSHPRTSPQNRTRSFGDGIKHYIA